jgi:hypothetical protein
VPRFFLVFFLLGQNRFQNVSGLRNMREIDLGRDPLRSARRRSASMAGRARSTLKLCAHFIRLVRFQRAGVRLAGAQADFR